MLFFVFKLAFKAAASFDILCGILQFGNLCEYLVSEQAAMIIAKLFVQRSFFSQIVCNQNTVPLFSSPGIYAEFSTGGFNNNVWRAADFLFAYHLHVLVVLCLPGG